MNLVEYQSKLESMIESQCFDQRSQLEKQSALSPEHQRLWEDFLILEQALPAWEQTMPEIDLVDAVLAQLTDTLSNSDLPSVTTDRVARPHRLSTPWIWTSLAAAGLLLAIVIPFFTNRPENETGLPVATSPPTPEPAAKQPTAPHDLNQLLKNAGAASWGLAQSTAGAMSEAVTLVPVSRSAPQSVDTLPSEPNWVDDINSEMQPIKDQFNHAWNFIIHSVPESSTKI